uniref:Uncharacterized protein n=1 Tax=Fagus sylvatica TaxID=28930 RepID=A0A2N9HY71_FAGSY
MSMITSFGYQWKSRAAGNSGLWQSVYRGCKINKENWLLKNDTRCEACGCRTPACVWHKHTRARVWKESPKYRRHVESLTKEISLVKDRLADEEAGHGAGFSIRSLEARVLDFECSGGEGARKQESWTCRRCLAPSMMVFPLYNDRSGDDLLVRGDFCSRKHLEY